MQKNIPPGPSCFSMVAEDVGNKLRYYLELMEDYGDIVKVPSFSRIYMVNNADMVKHVLKDNCENYLREDFAAHPLKIVLGNGLLLLQGAEWKKRRKTLAPVFQPKNILHLVPMIQTFANACFEHWDKNFSNDTSFDIHHEVLKIVYLIAVKAFFNQELDEKTLNKAIEAANFENHFSTTFSSFFPWLPTVSCWRYHDSKRFFKKHINTLIEKNQQTPVDNFMHALLHATDTHEQPLTPQAIFDEAKTFIMTGHETSGTAIAWAMYLLAEHPEKQQKLKAELNAVLAGRAPEFSDLVNLPYTHAVFSESIRLYPPIWNTGRVCQADDQMGDYFIHKGSKIILCPYVFHRRELYWDNPLEFLPERHLVADEKKPPMFAFIPFGAGPRVCIASHFATMESVIIIAMILQRYTLTLDEENPIALDPVISLKPKYGIKVFAEKN